MLLNKNKIIKTKHKIFKTIKDTLTKNIAYFTFHFTKLLDKSNIKEEGYTFALSLVSSFLMKIMKAGAGDN